VDVVVSAPRDRSAPDFESWATARLAALTRFAYLLTGSQSAADDAVQAALVRVCERWSRISRRDDPDSYVRRMVVNAHISAWRKTGRREPADDPTAAAAGLRVCVYRADQPGAATAGLTYASQLGRTELEAYLQALGSAPESADQCPADDSVGTQWVVLEFVDGRGGVLRRDVVHLVDGCAGIDTEAERLVGAVETVALSPELVEPWAARGVSATVYAPTGEGEPEYPGLIGPQG
jgi:DNA-directed RNA polymerase specialized sigma24 family protein